MPNHMLLMSFNDDNPIKLFVTLNRFFEYTIGLLEQKNEINFCYIGTAAKDRLIDSFFFQHFVKFKFGKRIKTSSLVLTSSISEQDIEIHLKTQDIIFIGGGDTGIMMEIWQNKGLTALLTKLKSEGKLPILAGVSAGGMYPFHSGLSDSIANQYTILSCLNWFKKSFCPHSNSKAKKLCVFDGKNYHNRLSAYQAAIKTELMPPGYAVPDNCMLHIYNDELIYALSSYPDNPCYFVNIDLTQAIDTLLLKKDNVLDIVKKSLIKIGITSK